MICKPCANDADREYMHLRCIGKLIHYSHCDCQCKNSRGEYIGVESSGGRPARNSIAFRLERDH